MIKCRLCGTRKGKRQCQAHSALVSSLCCGQSRDSSACHGCAFFKAPVRRYDALPRCSTQEMEDSAHLQKIAFPVEAAVCTLDRERQFGLQDAQAIEIFGILLDIYAFGESRETVSPRISALECGSALDLVERELRPYDRVTIAKVLATIRHVACRRADGGRHHLEILQRYCGSFVKTGVGLRILDDGTEMAVGEL